MPVYVAQSTCLEMGVCRQQWLLLDQARILINSSQMMRKSQKDRARISSFNCNPNGPNFSVFSKYGKLVALRAGLFAADQKILTVVAALCEKHNRGAAAVFTIHTYIITIISSSFVAKAPYQQRHRHYYDGISQFNTSWRPSIIVVVLHGPWKRHVYHQQAFVVGTRDGHSLLFTRNDGSLVRTY